MMQASGYGKIVRASCVLAIIELWTSPGISAGHDSTLVEEGKFRLHKFEQPIGEESYRISAIDDTLSASMDFKFSDRGGSVPLTASFRGGLDLTPASFDIRGRTSRFSSVDRSVRAYAGSIRIRENDRWSDTTRPGRFFTVEGYAPVTMQMLMVRYWESHGSPSDLYCPPRGNVAIVRSGLDTIAVGGKSVLLHRYTIRKLLWGGETLWCGADGNLIAVVTRDAEFDHFEAVREGFESALGKFVERAAADGMADLAAISRKISRTQSDTVAIVGGTLIDGTGRTPLPDAVVLIEHGRIAAAGSAQTVRVPTHAQRVDARGKSILPGLWDMHAHFEQVEWGPVYLAAGVTTVRDCGNELEFITAVRDAIAGGRGLGPRILAAGLVDGSGPQALGVARVDTPEQARLWVDRYHDAGFQQIKIYSSVKLEQIKAVATEAHRLGMTVTGHVPNGLNAFQVVEAGQDQINHFHYIMQVILPPFPPGTSREERIRVAGSLDANSPDVQKAIAFFKEHRTVIDPTLALAELFTATTAKPPSSFEPGATKVPPELAGALFTLGPPSPTSEASEMFFKKQLQILGALHNAGVTVVAGTDQTVPGYSLLREIELYVRAGFTPMEAIQAATSVPARVMHLDHEVGTIEPGKRADLILVEGDPLKDIHTIRNIAYVISGGSMYPAADLWQIAGFKP
jgi:imidazolonepropionase-like amidohydrolase